MTLFANMSSSVTSLEPRFPCWYAITRELGREEEEHNFNTQPAKSLQRSQQIRSYLIVANFAFDATVRVCTNDSLDDCTCMCASTSIIVEPGRMYPNTTRSMLQSMSSQNTLTHAPSPSMSWFYCRSRESNAPGCWERSATTTANAD